MINLLKKYIHIYYYLKKIEQYFTQFSSKTCMCLKQTNVQNNNNIKINKKMHIIKAGKMYLMTTLS